LCFLYNQCLFLRRPLFSSSLTLSRVSWFCLAPDRRSFKMWASSAKFSICLLSIPSREHCLQMDRTFSQLPPVFSCCGRLGSRSSKMRFMASRTGMGTAEGDTSLTLGTLKACSASLRSDSADLLLVAAVDKPRR